MRRLFNSVAFTAALMMATTPVLAAERSASSLPSGGLSTAAVTVGDRSVATGAEENELAGGFSLLAILGIGAVIAGIVLLVDNDDDDDLFDSPGG